MPETHGGWKVVYVRVPPELHRRLKILAAKKDTAASEIAREALVRYLDTEESSDG